MLNLLSLNRMKSNLVLLKQKREVTTIIVVKVDTMFKKNRVLGFTLLFFAFLFWGNFEGYATTEIPYPDYAYEFLGEDKYEKLNRKMFNFNMKMNKYAVRPLHVIWASIMPKFGMDRLQSIYDNVLYPRRLISSLIQKDFDGAKDETIRFLTNTTLGLGGMFDPAKRYFNIESNNADMEEALCACNIKQGSYLVCPVLSSASPRALLGKALDAALDPSSYLGIPFMSLVKLGFTINSTAYSQPLAYLIESTYADPYDIMKKLYGIETYLKTMPVEDVDEIENNDFKEVTGQVSDKQVLPVKNLNTENKVFGEVVSLNYTENVSQNEDLTNEKSLVFEDKNQDDSVSDYDDMFAQNMLALYGYASILEDEYLQNPTKISGNDKPSQDIVLVNLVLETLPLQTSLGADVILENYNSQGPVVDSMRTALFDSPDIYKSMWSELSIWNRSFGKRIKLSSVNIFPDRADYKFRFIMQKDKNSPVAIIYPSIGEGIMSHHSVVLAKLFYEQGYSVIIQGSHFQWAFVKSMPIDYRPGIPTKDVDYLKIVTTKIIDNLQDRYNCKFRDKVVIGTSFGAMSALFLGDSEAKENTLNISKYISINPPIELLYAMNQIDRNTAEWNKNTDNLKERVSYTAAKVLNLLQAENIDKEKFEAFPFSEDEAKLITGFIMHQKLSDLIFTIENGEKSNQPELYKMIRGMNYNEYAKKYLLKEDASDLSALAADTSLYSISDYLSQNDNYKIYHAINDYLVSEEQLKQLKNYCRKNLILMNNGSHLGFLYRKEFIDMLKQDIKRESVVDELVKGDV